MSEPERADEELMADYVDGDALAFQVLFKRYTPLLMHIAKAYTRSHTDARDIVQQTFLQLHRARQDYSPERRLRPYVTTICVNLCREQYRRKKRRPEDAEVFDVPVDATQHAQQESKQTAAMVQEALKKLPQNQQEVIALHWLSDMPFAEIAIALDVSVGAVKVRAHRGYEALRKILDQEKRQG